MCPSAATYAVLGSVGCTTIRPIASVRSSPTRVQLRPPSADRYTPPPGEMELRESSSPVPAYSTSGLEGATARSPMEITASRSKTGWKVVPRLVVFQIPPAAATT